MNEIASTKARKRCAVYCRVSTDERLDQEFNSIDAQKEAGHAYIASQRTEGWISVVDDYDDPGFSGGNTERPALKRLLADIERGQIDIVVVYKIVRLTRSLADFSKMVEVFERNEVSFVSVTHLQERGRDCPGRGVDADNGRSAAASGAAGPRHR